jgi:hypothetical protein
MILFALVVSCAGVSPSLEAETAKSTGIAFSRAKDWPHALEYFNKLVELEPKSPEASFLRAGARAGVGTPEALDAAVTDLQRYLELQPAAPDREQVLRTIGELRVRATAARDAIAEAARKQAAAEEAARQQAEAAAQVEATRIAREKANQGVEISADDGASATISVERDGKPHPCDEVNEKRPCFVQLDPGPATLRVNGRAQEVNVTEGRNKHRLHNNGHLFRILALAFGGAGALVCILGIILQNVVPIAVGGSFALLGAPLWGIDLLVPNVSVDQEVPAPVAAAIGSAAFAFSF